MPEKLHSPRLQPAFRRVRSLRGPGLTEVGFDALEIQRWLQQDAPLPRRNIRRGCVRGAPVVGAVAGCGPGTA